MSRSAAPATVQANGHRPRAAGWAASGPRLILGLTLYLLGTGLLLVALAIPLPDATAGVLSPVTGLAVGPEGTTQVGQSFYSAKPDLSRIDLALIIPPSAPVDVVARLRPTFEAPDLRQARIRIEPGQTQVSFRFEPLDMESRDRQLVLLVESADGAPLGIGLGLAPQPDDKGSLFALPSGDELPGQQLARQLVFQRHVLDLVPYVERVAANRPGLLGWRPLYLLLVYSYLTLAVVFLLRVARWPGSGETEPDAAPEMAAPAGETAAVGEGGPNPPGPPALGGRGE